MKEIERWKVQKPRFDLIRLLSEGDGGGKGICADGLREALRAGRETAGLDFGEYPLFIPQCFRGENVSILYRPGAALGLALLCVKPLRCN